MNSGMLQPVLLLLPLGFGPIQLSSLATYLARGLKEDQKNWLGKALPHITNIGMFLGDGTCLDAPP